VEEQDGSEFPIQFVDLDGGDLGRPEPGIVFDTTRATAGLADIDRWARALLKAKEAGRKKHETRFPVLAVGIVGPGKETAVRDTISKNLPPWVVVYTPPFSKEPMVFDLTNYDGTVSRHIVFYLYAE
jgi:hypothetical protein